MSESDVITSTVPANASASEARANSLITACASTAS